MKGKKRPDMVPGPRVQADYVENLMQMIKMTKIVRITPQNFAQIVIASKSSVGHWTELFMRCL